MSLTTILPAALLCCSILAACSGPGTASRNVVKGTAHSSDGVPIAYTARGKGDTTLFFIHGGFCDRSFSTHQIEAFRDSYRVVTIDLAGHGFSGTRENWTLATFGEDVKAVVDALELERLVFIGHSMGGPVSLQAASIMPSKVVGVIGVDTLHNAGAQPTEEQWRARIEAFRRDFEGTCDLFVREMFTKGADPNLVSDIQQRCVTFRPKRRWH